MRDGRLLERAFDVSQKHVVWYMKNRRLDGEPPPTQPLEYGTPLYAWKSGEESGADNSPRFDGGAQFAALDLSCYLANECYVLQAMAQKLGYRELAKTWGVRGDAIAEAARRQLWDPERGFFFDRKGPGGEWIGVWSHTGFLPLWAGVATPEQAAKLKEHLVSKKFWTAAPVPSVARDDPNYKADMWRGPTWMNMNYLILRGLQRSGFAAEAAELRERTLAAVAEWYGKTGALYEFYDCDGQTAPGELDRKGRLASGQGDPVISDYGWTAAVYVDLLLRPKP
jgi:neutral trehalase